MTQDDQSDKKSVTNVVDFTEKFQSVKDLQNYARAQFLTLLQANKRIEHIEAENRQLRSQIETLKDLAESKQKVEIISRSAEQDLCEIEIKRLRDAALQGPLTLEETKRMDLLVKNLYLAKGKPTANIKSTGRKVEQITDAELVQLATLPDGEKNKNE